VTHDASTGDPTRIGRDREDDTMNTTIRPAAYDSTVPFATSRSGRRRLATLRIALTNAALVALPMLFVLVEAAGRRAP
jgi:hypothetical protein